MNKQYIVSLLLVVAVLAIGIYVFCTSQQRTAEEDAKTTATFTDSAINLALEYNANAFSVIAGDNTEYPVGSSLVDMLSSYSGALPVRTSFILNESDHQGTNLFGAWVSVSSFTRGSATDTSLSCQSARYGDASVVLTETKDIGGTTWYYGTMTDAAAGTAFTKTVYHAMHGADCIELAQTIAAGNIGNWEPGAIQEFNREQVQEALDAVVNSVKFTE